MPERYFGRQIEVITKNGENDKIIPVSFKFNRREYIIAEVMESWPDYGFGRASGGRQRWWQQRHRYYYRVKTTDGEVYEIYYDRGVSKKNPESRKWYLTQRL
jgi:hypothetical protein